MVLHAKHKELIKHAFGCVDNFYNQWLIIKVFLLARVIFTAVRKQQNVKKDT